MATIRFVHSSGKGYGSAGASTTRRATKGFTAVSGSPREDIDFNNYTLRQRGRLMYMGNPIAASAVKTHRTNTIGLGLKLNPRPDADFLGLTKEQTAQWVDLVKREFSLFASHKETCDATGICDFYEMQQLLLTSWLTTGDVFVFIQEGKETPLSPYRLRLRTIEGDRISTPTEAGFAMPASMTTGQNRENGNRIYDGVEIDARGLPVAYHVRNTYPYESTEAATKWVRVEARGAETGLPNVIQIMNPERPDQYRGVSLVAPVIIPLLQLNRYTEAEVMAALIQAYQCAWITTTAPDVGDGGLFTETAPESGAEKDVVSDDENEYEIGPGTINYLGEGEKPEFTPATHPSASFDVFVNAIATQVGAALEIPREILMKEFTASYSASRGALLEAWKSFRMYRTWFVNDFCNPVYGLWMAEAVARGRISAPGFFTDPAVRQAWLRCEWIGPSQGQLDPVKEVTAEILACANGLSTHADSALRINGSEFDANMQQLLTEKELLDQLNAGNDGEINLDDEADGQEEEKQENSSHIILRMKV